MIVPVSKTNELEWAKLCTALWSDATDILNERSDSEFLYYIGDEAVAFINLALRHDYVEGTEHSPVGYVEGIYVKPQYRNKGIARKLIEFAKDWSNGHGCYELASDCEITNIDSRAFHNKIGFDEVNTIVCFKMNIK